METKPSPQLTKSIHKHNSAKNHLWAFALSIVFTLLAFYAVASEEVSRNFVVPFIIFLAVVQALFQLVIWMHLDQKEHEFPILGMASGVLIAAVTIIGLTIWIWL